MSTATLKLETLHLVPGLAEDFDQQLASLIQDCKNRPALSKARRVTVELLITPHPQDPDDVNIEPVTKTRCPTRSLDPVRARRTRKDQLQFDFEELE